MEGLKINNLTHWQASGTQTVPPSRKCNKDIRLRIEDDIHIFADESLEAVVGINPVSGYRP